MSDHPIQPHENNEDPESNPESEAPRSITRFLEIPKILHSVEKDQPFQNCLSCGTSLLTSNRHYVIEKVIRRNEVIIEMAMCLDCRTDHSDEGISEASAAVMQQFLEEKINFEQRLRLMSQINENDSLDPWLERCVLSDQHPARYSANTKLSPSAADHGYNAIFIPR